LTNGWTSESLKVTTQGRKLNLDAILGLIHTHLYPVTQHRPWLQNFFKKINK